MRPTFKERMRGFLPVVIDLETGGFNPARDALMQISAVLVDLQPDGRMQPGETVTCDVAPFEGANVEQASIDFTGIDPFASDRQALDEREALTQVFQMVRRALRAHGCTRAILVGHNAHFDHRFVFAAAERARIKRNPFHPFSALDTVSLGALAYGQTVLRKACEDAGIGFDENKAHDASYDAMKTAELFCTVFNTWHEKVGPVAVAVSEPEPAQETEADPVAAPASETDSGTDSGTDSEREKPAVRNDPEAGTA